MWTLDQGQTQQGDWTLIKKKKDQQGQKFSETLSQSISWAWWFSPVIPAPWET
jgi:hypothetical protein